MVATTKWSFALAFLSGCRKMSLLLYAVDVVLILLHKQIQEGFWLGIYGILRKSLS